jgi:hypothetical protein
MPLFGGPRPLNTIWEPDYAGPLHCHQLPVPSYITISPSVRPPTFIVRLQTLGRREHLEERFRIYTLQYSESIKCSISVCIFCSTARSQWLRCLSTWTVYTRSKAGIVDSNPTPGMDICLRLFCVYFVLCVRSGLPTGWSPVEGVLTTVYWIEKLKKRQKSNNKGL